MKKIPMRSCVVTKERLPKGELLRIVKNNENKVFVDLTGKANGRGAYIKKEMNVLKIARERRILERHLEVNIDDSVYAEIEKVING